MAYKYKKKPSELDDFLFAPLIDKSCSYFSMIEFVTICKLKSNLFRSVQKIDNCTNTSPNC
jgi:hypothetical protein